MIGIGNSFWGVSIPPFLVGNAKIYDGSFDYDVVLSWAQMQRTQTFTLFTHLNILALNTFKQIITQGANNPAGPNIDFFIANTNRLVVNLRGATTLQVASPANSIGLGRQSIAMTWDGNAGGAASGLNFYINGVLQTKTSTGTVTGSIINATNLNLFIGSASPNPTSYMRSNIKQLEIINRVATPAEILAASNAGSFRGAGIAHNSGQYLLAVDFDKTGTVSPTTFANTPAYTITSFGGASYTPYL